jgi:hypothetical protein
MEMLGFDESRVHCIITISHALCSVSFRPTLISQHNCIPQTLQSSNSPALPKSSTIPVRLLRGASHLTFADSTLEEMDPEDAQGLTFEEHVRAIVASILATPVSCLQDCDQLHGILIALYRSPLLPPARPARLPERP